METQTSSCTRPLQLTLKTNGIEVTQQLEAFKRDNGISILIAFCGTADENTDLPEGLFDNILKKLAQFTQVAILTGGTCGGVPEAATNAAKKHDLKVIAVVPVRAKQQNLLGNVDLRITVDPQGYESTWGSESALMIGLANAIVLINGGAGTLVELAHALKINSGRISQGPKPGVSNMATRQPIVIAPISGSGGVADLTHVLFATSLIQLEHWQQTFPPQPLRTFSAVTNYLIRALDLYETID